MGESSPHPSTPTAATLARLGLGVLAAWTLACGCSSKKSVTGTGDTGGTHLVVFASDRNQAAGQYALLLWDADTQSLRAMPGINTNFSEHHPTITSDGLYVAFQSNRGAGDNIYFYYRGKPDQGTFEVDSINRAEPESEPCFSGDGTMLTFVRGSSARRIHLFDNTTKKELPLPGLDASGTYSDYSPSPNYDASLIAFVSDRNGNPDVFIYSRVLQHVLDLPKLTPLRSAGEDLDPYFTPSGQYLVFSSDRSGLPGVHDLYLMSFIAAPYGDTTLVQLNTNDSGVDKRHPAISDNGSMIVFQSDRPSGQGRLDLWSYDRSSGLVSQGPNLSSAGDDIEPALKWRY